MDEFLIGLRESVEAGASTVEIKSGHYKITASSKSGVFVTKWPRPNANTKRFYRHVIAASGGVRPDIYALAKRVKQILADDAELSQLADICKRRARGNCHAR